MNIKHSARIFWIDYKEAVKTTNQFYKKHWKGALLLEAVVIGVSLEMVYLPSQIEFFKEKFKTRKLRREAIRTIKRQRKES